MKKVNEVNNFNKSFNKSFDKLMQLLYILKVYGKCTVATNNPIVFISDFKKITGHNLILKKIDKLGFFYAASLKKREIFKFHIRANDPTDELVIYTEFPNEKAVKPFAEFCLHTTKGAQRYFGNR